MLSTVLSIGGFGNDAKALVDLHSVRYDYNIVADTVEYIPHEYIVNKPFRIALRQGEIDQQRDPDR